jgi:hypothetical protein
MEFPIEIQMLINDYARPMTRPDWRKGSSIRRYLRLRGFRLDYDGFKTYIKWCQDEGNYRDNANYWELKQLSDDDILIMRKNAINDYIKYGPY